MTDDRRAFHDHKSRPLQMLDEPLCYDLGYECIGVVSALASAKARREGERRGEVVRARGVRATEIEQKRNSLAAKAASTRALRRASHSILAASTDGRAPGVTATQRLAGCLSGLLWAFMLVAFNPERMAPRRGAWTPKPPAALQIRRRAPQPSARAPRRLPTSVPRWLPVRRLE